MLYIRMLLLMAVSLYTSRVILLILGINDYGIYSLIAGFVTLFSFISQALVGAMQRFFNVAIGHGDREEYKRLYSMGRNVFLIFSALLLLFGETVGLWFVSTQLNIPSGRETAAMWVYQMSLLGLIVRLIRTPDEGSIIAHEQMEFYAYVSIAEALFKLGIVFVLNLMNFDKLILFAILYLLSTIVINVIYFLYCYYQIPDSRYQLFWDSRLFKKLVSFSGWNLLSGSSRVVKNQGESILINHYYTVSANAASGIAAQVYNAVNMFLTNFQTAFKPQLVQSYAENDIASHHRLVFRSAKLSYFLLLIIVVPIIFNLNELLQLWLKEVPIYTREFCLFLLFAYLFDSIGTPLAVSVSANGNIKGLQISITVLSVLGVLASFILLRKGALPYVVAIVTLFVHIGFWVANLYYARLLCSVNLREYVKKVMSPVLVITILTMVLPVAASFIQVQTWLVLLVCFVDFLWCVVVVFAVGFSSTERQYICKMLKIPYGKR